MTPNHGAPLPPPTLGALTPPEAPRSRSRKPVIAVVAVVAVIGAAVAIFLATRSDDTAKRSSAGTLVQFDLERGRVNVLAATGDVTDHFDGPDSETAEPLLPALDGRVIFDDSSAGTVSIMDISDGTITDVDVPEELSLDRTYDNAASHIVFDTPNGGDVVVVDLAGGDSTSAADELGDDEAKFVPGRRFPGGATFFDIGAHTTQTLVVPDQGSDLWAVPGSVIALDGERSLATASKEGRSTVTIADRDKEVGSVDVDALVVGGLLTGDTTALVVTTDGDVMTVDVDSGKTKDLHSLSGPAGTAVGISADRLFVIGEDSASSFLLDATGEQLLELEPAEDEDGNLQSFGLGPATIRPGARCFITQRGSEVRTDGGDVELRDLRTGDVVADLDSSAILLDTPDGCSAVTAFDETADAVLDGKAHEFDGYANVLAVSPDLSHVVVSGGDENGFALIDVASGDSVDLDRGVYTYVPS